MMTCSQSAAAQAEADNADNSNLTQEPSNEDQTQQPLTPTPTPSHHTPLQTPPFHTPPYHSTAILQPGPDIISPQPFSPSVPCAPYPDHTAGMTQALLMLTEELRRHDTSALTSSK